MAVEKDNAEKSATVLPRFLKIVLGWDYFRLLKESAAKQKNTSLNKVKDSYTDVSDYMETYEPLLFEEVKAHIVQAKDEEGGAETEWQKGGVVSCTEASDFHMVSMGVTEEFGRAVSENELLLLSSEKFQGGNTLPNAYAFALVEYRENQYDRVTLKLRTFLAGEISHIKAAKLESSTRLRKMLSALSADKAILWILKITSLSTIMREFIALRSISSLPFRDVILSATEKSSYERDKNHAWHVSKPLMEFLENNHNPSQLEAIYAGLARQTFVLIQGPPGTGKTQTILGLLSAILHAAPPSVRSKGSMSILRRRTELPMQDKYLNWEKSSPWLTSTNPRDLNMPVDGDDGFYPTSGNELKPEVVQSNRKYRVHVLVCAPSNSALDEIVLRVLNTGIRDENDHVYNPKIVRIGLKPHHSVQAVSMDYLVEQKLGSMDCTTAGTGKAALPDRDRIRASILDESAIVFSTLSFSGSSLFRRMNRIFDVVIIDEAAQAVEPATLVPLAHGCKQVYLVGDPVQLPATVISQTAQKFGYDMSLFKRFQLAGYPVQMLKTQYRMHPEIRNFPSKEFYSDSLDDGPYVGVHTVRPWHDYRCFGPFCFFDIDGVETQPSGSGSWVNLDEVEFTLVMYVKLVSMFPDLKSSSQLAIISPYRHQVKLFREQFQEKFGVNSDQMVDINTIDGFQGREKDVAIFSCVRANTGKGIGFVSDFRRMNVGITRARSSIFVVGSASTLMQDKHWSSLVNSAKDRNCLFKVAKPYTTFFSESNMKSMEIVKEDIGAMMEEVENLQETMLSNAIADGNTAGDADQTGQADDVDMDGDGGGDED